MPKHPEPPKHILAEMGPYGSIWVHIKLGKSHMVQDHFWAPLDTKNIRVKVRNTPPPPHLYAVVLTGYFGTATKQYVLDRIQLAQGISHVRRWTKRN